MRWWLFVALAMTGCRHEMADQAALRPLKEEPFFADGAASRPIPAHTVAQGAEVDEALATGFRNGREAETNPVPITAALLARGRERFEIFCAPCHGLTGQGDGMIVQRGFRRPPSFEEERLRQMPSGHVVAVIKNGFGTMYPYASRVPPADRWAIAGYVRALQLSQHAALEDAELVQRQQLEGQP